MNPSFVKPRFDRGGFAGIPARVKNAFASGAYDAVMLFFIDAFGWRFFEKFQDAPFLKRMAKQGSIEKITSQFPSTTAAHVTTIHTGLTVGESGVYEWFQYEPQLDAVIAPLLYSYAGSQYREDLSNTGIHPSLIYPRGVFYLELKSIGITPYYFGSWEHTPSTYSSVALAGAELIGFKTLSEAFTNVGLLLGQAQSPLYIHLYFDKFDSICHEYGPASPQAEAEIETFLLMMDYYFERIFKSRKRILFLMTADHGVVEVDPKTTVYLNRDPAFAGCERFLMTNRQGRYIVPAGSPRDMFLHIENQMLDDAQEFLAKRLEGKADAVKTESLIADGYFGPEVSKRFLDRVGNLVLLPYLSESVWWYEYEKFEMHYYGHHGGLTPQEMETVLYLVEL
jgi:hypothetical protein